MSLVPRTSRRKELAQVDGGEANAAFLLETSESFRDDRSRIRALLGPVDDAVIARISDKYRRFMHTLRSDRDKCMKKSVTRDNFFLLKFSTEKVFGDSTLSFVSSASCDASPVPLDSEIVRLIGKSVNSFAKACLGASASSSNTSYYRRWMRTVSLNTAKRKTICDLRMKLRKKDAQIALLKRKQVSPPSHDTSRDRSEKDQLRRELEAALLENQSLNDRIDSLLQEHTIVTKEKGKFTVDFHHLLIKLIAIGVPDSKVNSVIEAVAIFLNRSLSDYPSLGTIRNDAISLLALTIQQTKEVLEEVAGQNNLTLISDETTKRRHKMQAYLVNLERDKMSSRTFCLAIPEVFSKSASESLEALKSSLNRVDVAISGTVTGDLLRRFICSISSCMSDRAATQLLFNRLLEQFKKDILPTLRDDWEQLTDYERSQLIAVHTLYCQLHIAASITDVFLRVMGEMEGLSGEECSLLQVLKTCASHFSDRGSGKFQQLNKWLTFLNDKGVDKTHSILPSFDGQRFCIAFAIAARIFYLRDYLVEYITRFCSENETLRKASIALCSPLVISQLKTAALIDSFVSGPLIRLSEHSAHVLDTSQYVPELILYLGDCEINPARMISMTPPLITVGDRDRIFHLNSRYLTHAINAAQSPEDLTCISRACSEIKLFLEVQYSDFLPGGCYHSPSQSLVDSLSNAPSTSRAAERAFGMIDHLFVKSPNCRMIRREGVVMSRMNDTIRWLEDKPLEVQAQVLQNALGMKKRLEKVSADQKTGMTRKIMEDMLEKEKEVKRKADLAFKKSSDLTTVILTETGGYWRTVEAMDLALDDIGTKTGKIKALISQIQYRKSIKQPPPRPDIFVIRPKGIPATVERLRDNLVQLIGADLVTASSEKRVAPDWKGKRVERLVRNRSGFYTMVEGLIEKIEEVDGVLYVWIGYDDRDSDCILLEEFEEEIESQNSKFLGKHKSERKKRR